MLLIFQLYNFRRIENVLSFQNEVSKELHGQCSERNFSAITKALSDQKSTEPEMKKN